MEETIEIKIAKENLHISKITMWFTISSTILLLIISTFFGITQLPEKSNVGVNAYLGKNISGVNLLRQCLSNYDCGYNINDTSYNTFILKSEENYQVYNLAITNEGKSTTDISVLFKCNFEIIGASQFNFSSKPETLLEFRGNNLPSAIKVKQESITDLIVIELYSTSYLENAMCSITSLSSDTGIKKYNVYFKK